MLPVGDGCQRPARLPQQAVLGPLAAGMGADRIADFAASDLLDLTAFGVDTRAELEAIATITQVGANLLIDFADADSLTLNNFLDANLDNGDFMTNV